MVEHSLHSMNGIGVGTSVGLGTIIGLGLVSPDAPLVEYLTTFAFYGIFFGLLFEVARMLLSFRDLPPR